ncbi:hypothetical protein MMC15_005399 [Xylographa vitiligo]|nr:hypothetical protein [Xylographa vitiligo]
MDLTQKNENKPLFRTLSTTQSERSPGASLLEESPVYTSNLVQSDPLLTHRADVSFKPTSIEFSNKTSSLKESSVSASNLVQSDALTTHTTNLLSKKLSTKSFNSPGASGLKESPVPTINLIQSDALTTHTTNLLSKKLSTKSFNSPGASGLKESPVSTINLIQSDAPTTHTTNLLSKTLSTESFNSPGASGLKESPVSTSNLVQSNSLPTHNADVLLKPSSIEFLNTTSEDRQQSPLVVINEHPVLLVLPQISSRHSATKIRDFAYEPRLNLLQFPIPSPEASTAYHRPSIRSISSSRSTSLPPRLPRYLGNHESPTVSKLGRSVSLELPGLRAAYLPRRAISLPRIREHNRTALSTRFISSQVAESSLLGTTIIRRESTGRNPKIAVAAPLRIARTRTQLHTSTMASVDSAEKRQRDFEKSEALKLNFVERGLLSGKHLAATPTPAPLPPPQPLGAKKHGRWCRFKDWWNGKRSGVE